MDPKWHSLAKAELPFIIVSLGNLRDKTVFGAWMPSVLALPFFISFEYLGKPSDTIEQGCQVADSLTPLSFLSSFGHLGTLRDTPCMNSMWHPLTKIKHLSLALSLPLIIASLLEIKGHTDP